MADASFTLHSADAIVIRNDSQSGLQHIFLQCNASGHYELQYLHSTFEHPDNVDSTIIKISNLRFLVFFDRVLQQTLRKQGIYIFLGLNNDNRLVDLHAEHHLMQVALAMDT